MRPSPAPPTRRWITRTWSLALVAGVSGAFGAFAAHFFDADRGRSRRARVRDRSQATVRHVARRLSTVTRRRIRYRWGRLHGVLHRTTHPRGHPPVDDIELVQRIRSQALRRRGFSRLPVLVEACEGNVTMRGQLDSVDDIAELERMVRQVIGVRDVTNLLHTPDTPAPNKVEALRVHVPMAGGNGYR
jgi:BON domain